MGNHPSAHQPLERATSHSGNALRLSKRERSPGKRMDRLRRSFRDSFRRRKDPHVPESSKPHQWQSDESAVRSATCAFHVKYLGCVEVFESRGMQVCEEALKVLRNSRRRPVRAILHVSGDGLRVVEDETKGLIVDQTIEKVSFCAPDRNHEKGFSYICRDGTTRRWMCHGFLALKESGERLSHAVGCAFAACLERKQRRDKECGVTMTFDSKTSTFTRSGSFRQPSLTERLQDTRERSVDVPPVKQVFNPFAIERPHATPSMLERQGSFRGFNQLNQASPFKRQLSLRVSDLPSNLERTRSHSLEPTDLTRIPQTHSHTMPLKPPVSPIPEISPSGQDSVSAMCQQLSQGLSLLSSSDDYGPLPSQSTVAKQLFTSRSSPPVTTSNSMDDIRLQNGSTINNNINNNNNNSNNNNGDERTTRTNVNHVEISWQDSSTALTVTASSQRLTPILNRSCNLSPVSGDPTAMTTTTTTATTNVMALNTSVGQTNRVVAYCGPTAASPSFSSASTSSVGSSVTSALNRSPLPINNAPTPLTRSPNASVTSSMSLSSSASSTTTTTRLADDVKPSVAQVRKVETLESVTTSGDLPKPEQWLGSLTGSVRAPLQQTTVSIQQQQQQQVIPRRPPPLHARAHSLGSSAIGNALSRGGPADPFDAEWAEIAARNLRQASSAATNPFIVPNTTQAFQVQL